MFGYISTYRAESGQPMGTAWYKHVADSGDPYGANFDFTKRQYEQTFLDGLREMSH